MNNLPAHTPKVSVIMPVFNGKRYLREAIDSILAQTFTDYEFIIIDDGSTDGTRDIINSYSDQRIVNLHHHTNLGITRSLNDGLKVARGELIARQDADDISLPERLALQVNFLNSNKKVGLVGTRWLRTINENESRAASCHTMNFDIKFLLLFSNQFVHTSVVFRKRLIDQFGGYSEQHNGSEDYELWTRLSCHTLFANLENVLVTYRRTPGSITLGRGTYPTDVSLGISFRCLAAFVPQARPEALKFLQMIARGHGRFLSPPRFNLEVSECLSEIRDEVWPSLVENFCNHNEISGGERKKHWRKANGWLSLSLLRLAHNQLNRSDYAGDRVGVSRLLGYAAELSSFSLVKKETAKSILKLLLGPTACRALKNTILGT